MYVCIHVHIYLYIYLFYIHMQAHTLFVRTNALENTQTNINMGRLRLVGSLKSWVSSAKEPYKSDDILQKRPTLSITHKQIRTCVSIDPSTIYVVNSKKKSPPTPCAQLVAGGLILSLSI